MVTKYQKRISGPLLDRIDTACRIEVPRVDYEKLSGDRVSESSEAIRRRVQGARNIQQARFTNPESRVSNNGSSTDIVCNADMRVGEVRQFCGLQAGGAAVQAEDHDEGGFRELAGLVYRQDWKNQRFPFYSCDRKSDFSHLSCQLKPSRMN